MKKFIMGFVAVLVVLSIPNFAMAVESASGSLVVTGTVASSIGLTVDSADGTFAGAGIDTSTDLGTISKYGAPPTGFTITKGGTSWTLTSINGIGVKVSKANIADTTYTLSAKLNADPAGSVAWTVGSVLLNSTAFQTLPQSHPFGTAYPYAWTIVIPDALATTATFGNTIMFSVVSAG